MRRASPTTAWSTGVPPADVLAARVDLDDDLARPGKNSLYGKSVPTISSRSQPSNATALAWLPISPDWPTS